VHHRRGIRGLLTGPQAKRRLVTGGDRIDPEELESLSSERCARVSGFSLHARERLRMQAREGAAIKECRSARTGSSGVGKIDPLYGPSAAGQRAGGNAA